MWFLNLRLGCAAKVRGGCPCAASPRPSSWSLMELPPFPAERGMVGGVSQGQSLHPSGCVTAMWRTAYNLSAMPLSEDPLSHAELATLTVWAPLGTRAVGR